MKKIWSMFFAFILSAGALICTLPLVSADAAGSGTCGDNLIWTLDDTGTLTISGKGEMYDEESLLWYDEDLTRVIINDGVTSIGKGAFYHNFSLASVSLSPSITRIGDHAFYSCSLTGIDFPSGMRSIGYAAFGENERLTSVSIPASVISIGEGAFVSCDALAEIEVDRNNAAFCSVDGVLYSKEKDMLYCVPPAGVSGKYSIPSGVTRICDGAFSNCTGLTSVIIPTSVTSIGDNAFDQCENLADITIPPNVTSIGIRAFSYCFNLTSVTIPSGVTSIDDQAFYWCESLSDVYYGGTEEQWRQIRMGTYNEVLANVTVHYDVMIPEDDISTPDGIENNNTDGKPINEKTDKTDGTKNEDAADKKTEYETDKPESGKEKGTILKSVLIIACCVIVACAIALILLKKSGKTISVSVRSESNAPTPSSDNRYCPYCGTPTPPGARFCRNCGRKL